MSSEALGDSERLLVDNVVMLSSLRALVFRMAMGCVP